MKRTAQFMLRWTQPRAYDIDQDSELHELLLPQHIITKT